jgi:hypothetical protein
MRRLAAAAALAALAALAPAGASPLGAAEGPDGCQLVAFSPNVASDHLGLCVGFTTDFTGASPQFTVAYAVYATHDLGHTWGPVPAAGLIPDDFSTLGGVAFSPAFATDHTIFLQTVTADGGGVFASTDLGASWASVDSTVADQLDDLEALAPTGVAGTPATLPTAVSVARPSTGDEVARTVGPLHASAAGSPDDDVDYVPAANVMLARTSTAATETDATHEHATLYGCDAQLTCTTVLHAWPRGELPERAWSAPDYARSHELVVLTRGLDPYRTLHAWVSHDGGAHVTAWTSLNRLLADHARRDGGGVQASVAWRAGSPRSRYVRIASQTGHYSAGPYDAIYRSTDSGATWRRLAARHCALVAETVKCAGEEPWEEATGYAARHLADLSVLPDGRLVVVGVGMDIAPVTNLVSFYFGTFCSVDDGKHWAKDCAR